MLFIVNLSNVTYYYYCRWIYIEQLHIYITNKRTNKFYGSSTDDPARDRSARALAGIKVRLSLPYNRQVAWDLEQFPLVARREARHDITIINW